jgi:glutamine amidotransferase
MKAAIVDYGAGNLHSLAKALVIAGAEVRITTDVEEALTSEVLVLPGVGNFDRAMQSLAASRSSRRAKLKSGMPCIGVCLGMQLLFDSSEEGEEQGIGLIAGHVRRLRAKRIPQIGWNSVEPIAQELNSANQISSVYYANSFVCEPSDTSCVTATTTYEDDTFPAAIAVGRTAGVQFHPEKSSLAGVALLATLLKQVTR